MSRKKNSKENIDLSVIVITKNEEERIKNCLSHLGFAGEIIVVDSGSEDKTMSLAKEAGAKVIEVENKGFSFWRNEGAKKAGSRWLLYVDADEIVSDGLRKEIVKKLKNPGEYCAFAIPRKNILLGKEVRWGGWWPDYVLRLIKKDSLEGYKGRLHEQPEIKGKVGKLENPLIHNTHRSLTLMVEKTNQWSEIEAKLMYEAGHPKMNIFRFLSAGFREFWYRGVRKLGFLDGAVGVIEIIYQTYSRFISYAKLWEMQLEGKKKK